MTFGYLIIVNDKNDTNYLNLAYALALSIKNTQKEGYDKVALVIDNKDRLKNLTSPWVFDEVIENDRHEHWNGRSYMDFLSPWEATVCLDADMLFTRDYSHWIDYFIKNCDLYIANSAYTYRGEKITSDHYRKCFTANKLPNLYSYFTFFKKFNVMMEEFFDLNREIIENPVLYANNFLSAYKPSVIGTDEAFSLAAKILGIADDISYPLSFPRVVHCKGMLQNWPYPADNVFDHVGFYIDRKGKIKIGNYQQHDIVHYVDKEKVTAETINILEEIAWKKT